MTDVRSSGVNTIIDVVPDVQLTLYIRMGERISAGGPQVRLNEVELAASTITGNGYAVGSNITYCPILILNIFCLILILY